MTTNTNTNNPGTMEDKDMLKDALSTEKFLAATYSTYATECVAKNLHQDFLNLLQETHQIQHDIFSEMHNRGWYPTPAAEQTKIDQAKQKYMNQKP